MKCPMSYSETVVIGGIECRQPAMDCRPDCAWRIKDTHGNYGCAVSALAIDVGRENLKAANFEKLRAKGGE